MKSYKTNSTVHVLQGLPLKQVEPTTEVLSQKEQTGQTMKRTTLNYPGVPWHKLDLTKKYQDPYGKTTFIKTLGAFGATGKESVSDMVQMSRTISSNL